MIKKNTYIKLRITTVLFIQFSLFLVAQEQQDLTEKLPEVNGLLLDLNADYGIKIEDGDKISSWSNQVTNNGANIFVKQDKGRKVPGSGRPSLSLNVPKINGHNTAIFRQQELICHNEDVFDKLTTGSGYTWFSVMSVYEQRGGGTNAFFGNLRNSNMDRKGKYEGFWGVLKKNNTVWMGSRNGEPYDNKLNDKNPKILSPFALDKERYYLVMGRMDAGVDSVTTALFINNKTPLAAKRFSVKTDDNPSKLVIGQERNATNHPGGESFDGEIARFLIYDRPLTEKEFSEMTDYLIEMYSIKNTDATSEK